MQNQMSSHFGALLWPGIRAIWGDTYKDLPKTYEKIFTVKTSDKAWEREQQITGLGLAHIKREGASIEYDSMMQGFQKEYTHITYALGSSVSWEAYEDDQYGKINKLPKHIARSMVHTEEVVAYNVLNNSFTTEMGADGVSLMNSNHPLVGGGVASNVLATPADLSETSLQDILTQIGYATDDKGLRIVLNPKKLIIPRALQWVAKTILESELSTTLATNSTTGVTNTNALNTVKGMLEVHDSPRLIDDDAWWIQTDCEDGLTFYRRSPAKFDRDNEFNTLNLNFVGYERFSVGATDWRNLYGSAGA